MKILLVLREQRFELYACYLYLSYGIPPSRCFSSLSIPKIFLPNHFVAIDFLPAREKKIYDIYTISLLEILSRRILYLLIAKVHRNRIIFEYCHQNDHHGRSLSVAYKTTNCALLNFFFIFLFTFILSSSRKLHDFFILIMRTWLYFCQYRFCLALILYISINIYQFILKLWLEGFRKTHMLQKSKKL